MPKHAVSNHPVLAHARKWYAQQVAWRRHLHQHPELSNQEIETTAFIKSQLKKLGIKTLPLKGMKTGVLAHITGAHPGPTVALRGDIDALAVEERTGLPYASKVPGRMHACGHDLHTATVLGAAAILNEMRSDLHGNVRLLFQPSEEMPPGGASRMIAAGAIKDVDMIVAVHTDPHLAVGKIGLRDGAAMASVYDFDVIIHGIGGHAASPHLAVDAITTAAEVVEGIQKIVSRETGPMAPALITFGQVVGGTARNVIADRVTLSATARTLSATTLKRLPRLIRRTVSGICQARGARFEIVEIASYPGLWNHPKVNRLVERSFQTMFGNASIVEVEGILGGEDFACYLQQVPGAWVRVGVMNKKLKADKPWHSPEFRVDEESIFYGTVMLVAAALEFTHQRTA
jgi:amidohydrolase